MRYYLGPWQQTEIEPGMFGYVPPPETVGLLDLRSIPGHGASAYGFFALADGAPKLDSSYTLLGQGHVADLAPDARAKSAWETLLGVRPADSLLIDWLWQSITVDADPSGESKVPPLMPTTRQELELHLGGHSVVRRKRFDLGMPEAAPVIDRLQRQYRAIREEARSGRINGDPEFHRRVLDYWGEKYRLSNPEDVFVPGDLPRERRLKHSTTLTESFNKADGTTLGPDQTWVEDAGDWEVVSNEARANAGNSVARVSTLLSSDDHYSQFTVTAIGSSSPFHGVLGRKANSATLTYYYFRYSHGQTESQLWKVESGSFTKLDFTAETAAAPFTVRLDCDGSTISGTRAGVLKASVTDTAIAGNLAVGMRDSDEASSGRVDDFIAEDLDAGGGATKSVSDTAAASDQIGGLSVSLSIADTGAGSDALPGTSVAASLSDAGVGADALAVAVALGLTDTGVGSDSLAALTAALRITDTASGLDAIARVDVVLGISDAGAGADLVSVLTEVLKTVTDTAAGSDAVGGVAVSFGVADAGAGADAIGTLSASLGVVDTASGADAVSVLAAALKAISDSAIGTDAVGGITAQLRLADTATGTDLVAAISAILALADSGLGVDAVARFDAVTRIVTITFALKQRSIVFSALKQRSITFSLHA